MKTAILFGATGLVGSHLLNLLVESNEYDKIKIFSRREIKISNPKIETLIIDFKELEKKGLAELTILNGVGVRTYFWLPRET